MTQERHNWKNIKFTSFAIGKSNIRDTDEITATFNHSEAHDERNVNFSKVPNVPPVIQVTLMV